MKRLVLLAATLAALAMPAAASVCPDDSAAGVSGGFLTGDEFLQMDGVRQVG